MTDLGRVADRRPMESPVLSLAVFQFASTIEPKLASDAKLSYVRRPSDNLES